jgi:hypothetical protein
VGEMRKQFCICGWQRIIVETEYRPFDKRIGGKDILLCAECVAAREAGSPQFQEDYAAAIKGTHASVTNTRVVLAKKEPKLAPDEADKKFLGRLYAPKFPTSGTFNSLDLRKWFRRGVLVGLLWASSMLVALIMTGLVHLR